MSGIMDAYRAKQPIALGGIPVVSIRDIKTGFEWETGNPGKRKIDLPESDVLQWRLRDGTLVTVRPSGTEPKLKYYILCKTDVRDSRRRKRRQEKRSRLSKLTYGRS